MGYLWARIERSHDHLLHTLRYRSLRRRTLRRLCSHVGEAIPRAGADLIGYFGPHEGSASTAYGVYSLPDLAAYESYRARLREDPIGREAFAFAREHRFIRYEERLFLKPLTGVSR